MRRVLTMFSALLLGLSSLLMAPSMATAQSAAPGQMGYAAGDAVLGAGASAQHLTFAMVDCGRVDRGSVTYTNAGAGVAYHAPVMAVEATNSGARFAYRVPESAPASVRGLIIVWQVTDGSGDAAAFSVAATETQARAMVDTGFTPSNSYAVNRGGLETALAATYGLRGYALGNSAFGTGSQTRQHLAFVVLDYGPTLDKGVAFYANLDSQVRYEAPTTVVRVYGSEARFAYTIPAGTGSLSGVVVAWKVTDRTADTAGFSVAGSLAQAAAMVNAGFTPTNAYSVPAGSITVVQLYRLVGHATGGVWFGPSGSAQKMTFQVYDYAWTPDKGTVSYQNTSQGIAYRAYVRDVRVVSHVAYFDYVIPSGSLKGTIVVWKVLDRGSPGAGHDVVGFSVASSLTAARSMVARGFTPTNSYLVTGGNLTVHLP
jgi:hypothetical protein